MEKAVSPALSSGAAAATPLLTQYFAIKEKHQDCLLFFRLGDFYEMFFDDAVKAARALDLTLTRRGQHNGQEVPMCGVPFHAADNYMARLIRQGFHVAICEQVEDPAEAKKRGAKSVVKRDVVRIITPGTATEDNLLSRHQSNYLVALARVGDETAAAWIDLAEAQPFCQTIIGSEASALLTRLDASEILLSEKLHDDPEMQEALAPFLLRLTVQPNSRFDSENARLRMQQTYRVETLDSFGAFSRAEVTALGVLIDYVALTQKSDLSHVMPPQSKGASLVLIDAATQRNLELVRTLQGERAGSLLAAIDRTQTGAGARLLATRLVAPLTDVTVIEARLSAVSFLHKAANLRGKMQEILKQTPDLERALARLALSRGGPRDLAGVREALAQATKARHLLQQTESLPEILRTLVVDLGEYSALTDLLERALAAELPLLARDGGFIARGYSAPLDELLTLRDDSRRLIAGLQQKYADDVGVLALKIKHNLLIGYYIEASPQHADKLLAKVDTYIHRQSMAGSMRFTTVELGELERKISEAADRALALELKLFDALVSEVLTHYADLRRVASALAKLDVTTALAALAAEQNYVCPTVDNSLAFAIVGGRHPVVEQSLAGGAFVGNGCDLTDQQRLWLITGPNMAGKSTFLRQNALIVLLAQIGSFVPAKSAHIGIVDRLFSRVGAADDLARGRSTFMVEMVETAAILNQASARALVILDEIGRGTATYDGLSIAWATLEHLHDVNHCRTLFATHYHELTALAGSLSALHCVTMKIKEWDQQIVFLHEVVAGTADRSYGLHVAKMAGLPAAVLMRASQVLANLESQSREKDNRIKASLADLPLFVASAERVEAAPAFLGASLPSELAEKLTALDPDSLTPKQALEAIYLIKKLAQDL